MGGNITMFVVFKKHYYAVLGSKQVHQQLHIKSKQRKTFFWLWWFSKIGNDIINQ
jgi:hypothetical protein